MSIFNKLLDRVVEFNASDLYMSTNFHPAIRVNGVLKSVTNVPPTTKEDMNLLLYDLLSEQQRQRFTDTHELDFGYTYKAPDGSIARFRGNCSKNIRGIAIVLRLIPSKILSLTELGLPKALEKIATHHRGLFLVTGATGHGKSTTLTSIVDRINRTRNAHIVTIEDPVEYIHTPINSVIHQREVGEDTNSFHDALKHVLRQDPDVIMIGELRDLETISVALTAAETGHLVLGTLHTQDAPQSIDRLIDVFPPNQQPQVRTQLASVLIGICSQQLIPNVDGGRTCASEILVATPAIKNCIREGKITQIRTLLQTGSSEGMRTMEQCLMDMVLKGTITQETAESYAYDFNDFQQIWRS